MNYGSFYRRDQRLKEQQRITQFAPRIRCKGPHIRGFEQLSRVAIFPDHTHIDGKLKVEGIAREDLTKRGFSVFRNEYTSIACVEDFIGKQIERKPEREFKHVLMFSVGMARQLQDSENCQAFIVIDDSATKQLSGHVLILCSDNQTKSKVKELRRKLADILNNQIPLQAAFS
mgnify:CR=1 FL=1